MSLIGNNLKKIDASHIRFSDGGSNLKIDHQALKDSSIVILSVWDLPVDSYLFVLENFLAIVRKYSNITTKVLYLSYLPHARADREFEEGMSVPLEIIINTINKFDKVYVEDVHNESAFKKYCKTEYEIISQAKLFIQALPKSVLKKDFVLCAPDFGATLKISALINLVEKEVVVCEKKRNTSTGWIDSVEVCGNKDIKGRDIIIVDDICDGGMTFIKTAEALKNKGATSVSLYVSHGIFSRGVDIFKGVLDKIYYHRIVSGFVTHQDIEEFNNRGC
jgi:ribose-phosphate pyrophosphokinase